MNLASILFVDFWIYWYFEFPTKRIQQKRSSLQSIRQNPIISIFIIMEVIIASAIDIILLPIYLLAPVMPIITILSMLLG